jgi:hypothetical protein
MTTSRLIEYRITRDLLQRRESASRHPHADLFIKGLAIFAGVAAVSLLLPQLLLPIFVTSFVLILGF